MKRMVQQVVQDVRSTKERRVGRVDERLAAWKQRWSKDELPMLKKRSWFQVLLPRALAPVLQ